ncbi:uncharacterized protein EDB91DRAFT_1256698 [Suillus paluster]|uniref:uncharacterized protein n=1 Tax=Suillus paluster TaxID=48578 RepID=UPI001B8643FB|nr:uncharacterized protein EDB91DRAFT_1256698 [Suillus paluster]KAG1721046.1 hypothetical protein EDB91DRAFT_1256698 [Suillus paluster]
MSAPLKSHELCELVDKNQVTLQSLLTVAGNCGAHAIKEHLQTDAQYGAHLASLLNDNALPIGKKPYQGDLLIFLIYEGVFSGVKSIGVKFAECFAELVNNKGNCPECPIPLLALVATVAYAALFWKTLGSPGKFNFTGNQFS